LTSYESNSVKTGSSVWSRDATEFVVTKKDKLKTMREWYFTHLPGFPIGAIGLNFGLRGHVADLITRAKFCDNRFRDFGVLIPIILPFSIGIAGRPYNSVRLHCDERQPYSMPTASKKESKQISSTGHKLHRAAHANWTCIYNNW